MTACGDKGKDNGEKFDPENDWLTITANTIDDLNKLATVHDELFPREECPDGMVCPQLGLARGYIRNVVVRGNLDELYLEGNNKLDRTTIAVYEGIYNLDLSQTKLKTLTFKVFPTKVKSVVLPETLVDMGAAFWGCSELGVMEIPKNVATIHDYNFSGLNEFFAGVIINTATPPEILYAKDLSGGSEQTYPPVYPKSAWRLIVPAGSLDAYMAHEWWGRFGVFSEK